MTKNPFARGVLLVGAGLASVLHSALPAVAQDLEAMRPIAAFSTVFIEEMTWMEVRDAIREGTTTAIVATGGVEQNGPYVASGKHNFVLQATTEAIALELGNALVAPSSSSCPKATSIRRPATCGFTRRFPCPKKRSPPCSRI